MKLEIQKKADLLVKEVQNSKSLSADEKGDLQDILIHAEEGTNGLTQEEKLQNVSETVFSIVSMMVAQKLDGFGRLAGLYRVIEACKWQITIIAGIIGTCLIFRPEISNVIAGLIAK